MPAVFDGCLVVDHSLLPDMSWWLPACRRVSALVTAQAIDEAGGTINASICNGAQKLCDTACELPFGLAHRYGNGRIDHSCLIVTAMPAAKVPFALTWQAAGEFESEGWQEAEMSDRVRRNNPLFGSGELTVTEDRLAARFASGPGRPRPELAAELLQTHGAAIRVGLPSSSKVWLLAAMAGLPAGTGGELRVSFGDPARIALTVTARDEEGAEKWAIRGKEQLAVMCDDLVRRMPPSLAEDARITALVAQLRKAEISTHGDEVRCDLALHGVTPELACHVLRSFALQR